MKQNIIHIGLDVDDTQYHGSAFNKETGEVIDFKSRPTLKGLLQQLDRMARHFKGIKSSCVTRPPTSVTACNVTWCPTVFIVISSLPAVFPARVAKPSRPTASMRATWRSFTPMTY